MPETTTLRCQACGQGWQLHQTDVFNQLPAQFCPICGTPTLERDPSALALKAKCFTGVNAKLVELLYTTWRLDLDKDGAMQEHKRFIDYIHAQLTGD